MNPPPLPGGGTDNGAATEVEPPPGAADFERATTYRDVVVIGTSAGGVTALTELFRRLPAEFPASIFIVMHVMPSSTSLLPAILARSGRLPVAAATDGEPVLRGRAYVAPPDHHMVLADGHVALTVGPRENGHRPAIDTLFRSAARAYGSRVIAVVLSGSLDDGTAGMRAVKDHGGIGIAQHPADALYPAMPSNAAEGAPADYVVAVPEMPALLSRLFEEPVDEDRGEPGAGAAVGGDQAQLLSTRSTLELTCPDCGGALNEILEGGGVLFACRVGHAYSPESLVSRQGAKVEEALWAAVRSLDERADLLRRTAGRTALPGSSRSTRRLEERALEAEEHAGLVRRAIAGLAPVAADREESIE